MIAAELAPAFVNERSQPPRSPEVATRAPKVSSRRKTSGFCNPTNPRGTSYDPHGRCAMPACECCCHDGFDLEDVAELMVLGVCAECRRPWDAHDYDDPERVFCRGCRRW